jgi:hypothetical protein
VLGGNARLDERLRWSSAARLVYLPVDGLPLPIHLRGGLTGNGAPTAYRATQRMPVHDSDAGEPRQAEHERSGWRPDVTFEESDVAAAQQTAELNDRPPQVAHSVCNARVQIAGVAGRRDCEICTRSPLLEGAVT